MSKRFKASLAALAVAIAFAAATAVAAAPTAANCEAGNGSVAYFLGRLIETS